MNNTSMEIKKILFYNESESLLQLNKFKLQELKEVYNWHIRFRSTNCKKCRSKNEIIKVLQEFAIEPKNKKTLGYYIVYDTKKEILNSCKSSKEFKEIMSNIDDELLKASYCEKDVYDREKALELEYKNNSSELFYLDEYYNSEPITIKKGEYVIDYVFYNVIRADGFHRVSNDCIASKKIMEEALENNDLEKVEGYKPLIIYRANKDIETRVISVSQKKKKTIVASMFEDVEDVAYSIDCNLQTTEERGFNLDLFQD